MNSYQEILQKKFNEDIKLTNNIGIIVSNYDKIGLTLKAPLQPNINDKLTAFGGSLYSVSVLTGWGLFYLKTLEEEISADIAIYKSNSTFIRPVQGDFQATCQTPSSKEWDELFSNFHTFGKAKLNLKVIIKSNDKPAFSFNGKYVIFKKS